MAEKSRVFLFTTSYLPLIGGSEIAIHELTRRLPEFEFDIITGRLNSELAAFESDQNTHIYRVGSSLSAASFLLPKNFLPLAAFFKAFRLNRRHHYQIMHAYQASQAAGGAWLFKVFNPSVKFILTIQEGKDLKAQGWLTNLFRNMIIRSADEIVVISQYLKDYVNQIAPHAPVRIIPNGVDLELFKPMDDVALKEQLGLSHQKIIISVSRLVEKNGIADLIEAFAQVVSQKSQVHLLLAGEGPLRESLEQAVDRLAIKDHVSFLGRIEYKELPRYLSLADVFTRPSHSEGFGSAFVEAMACGVPVVGTPVGGIPDIITNEETGLFCQAKNPRNIASVLSRVLSDDVLRKRLAQAGKVKVTRSFQWQNVADQVRSIYRAYV